MTLPLPYIKLSRGEQELLLPGTAWARIVAAVAELHGGFESFPFPPLAFGPRCVVLDDDALDIAAATYELLCVAVEDHGGVPLWQLMDDDVADPLLALAKFADGGGEIGGAGFMLELVATP